MKVLKPIWVSKQTAQRLRGRIEAVLGWATTMKLRSGDNPAQWGNHLRKLTAGTQQGHPVKHHAAMPYTDLPAFMAELRSTKAFPLGRSNSRSLPRCARAKSSARNGPNSI